MVLRPGEQLVLIREQIAVLDKISHDLLKNTLIPQLDAANVHIRNYDDLNGS